MVTLIFDCDGTLVDSEFLHAQVEVDILKENFGIVTTAVEHNKKFCGAGLTKLCEWLEQKIGHPLPPNFIEELSNRKIDVFQKQLKTVSYMEDVLNEIAGIPKCVASNTPLETVKASLQATKLYEWFEPHIYSAQMVAHGKPKPDLFLYAAQQMNAVTQDCIVIEDSPHGVTAALAANMRVFGFIGGSHCYPEYKEKLRKAEIVFSDMRELPRLITAVK